MKLFKSVMNSLKTDKDNGNPSIMDYDIYILNQKELLMYLLFSAGFIFIVAYIFYQSVILALICSPLAIFYPRIKIQDIIKKRRNELSLQFKDMLYSISSSMYAGRSIESSFTEVLKDLAIVYPDENTYILKEVKYITKKIDLNETVEEAFGDFAKRANLEDAENFVEVFRTCRKTGGNLIEVIRNTSNIINSKIETKIEIETMISQRKFEQKILSLMPIALILMLSLTAADYMAPIFNSILGRIIMTFALIIISAGYFISKKMMDIEI